MNALYVLEPESPGAAWAPFQGVRPVAELRAGIWRVRERWEAAAGTDAAAESIAVEIKGFLVAWRDADYADPPFD